MPPTSKKRILILVRTYPVPAHKGAETSCTAGITEHGDWIRLFPVPYRSLPPERRFSKYQWIDANVKKASDHRAESHNIDTASIELKEVVSPVDDWAQRKSLLRPLMRPSMCAIRKERDDNGHPTLGLFRPKSIKRLLIEPSDNSDWTPAQRAILSQKEFGFDSAAPKDELEKIPFDFYYEFVCDDPACKGHKMSCTDWEMAEAYRKWKRQHGNGWEAKFRERFERDMIEKFDTHFFVGTMHGHPGTWLIVGLFYPPKQHTKDLFD